MHNVRGLIHRMSNSLCSEGVQSRLYLRTRVLSPDVKHEYRCDEEQRHDKYRYGSSAKQNNIFIHKFILWQAVQYLISPSKILCFEIEIKSEMYSHFDSWWVVCVISPHTTRTRSSVAISRGSCRSSFPLSHSSRTASSRCHSLARRTTTWSHRRWTRCSWLIFRTDHTIVWIKLQKRLLQFFWNVIILTSHVNCYHFCEVSCKSLIIHNTLAIFSCREDWSFDGFESTNWRDVSMLPK